MAGMRERKPFKLWNWDRTVKKSITAVSLAELCERGREKFNVPETECVRIVLEEDGTEIEEEDYFTFLPFNTTLILLTGTEKWALPGTETGTDEPDFMMPDGSEVPDRVKQLVAGLQREIMRIITFSNDDLQLLVDMKVTDLAQMLGDTEAYAVSVQEACQRHLDEREQSTEAMQLLRLYDKARKNSPYVDEEDPKRRKFAQT